MKKKSPLNAGEFLKANTLLSKTGCIEYTGTLDRGLYGCLPKSVFGSRRAHRVAYQLVHGQIAPELCVCHRCDNPKCVNVEHLFVGTRQDNIRDKISKGRQSGGALPGALNPNHKITAAIVSEIRKCKNLGINWRRIKDAFGISQSQYYRIVNRQAWRGEL